MVVTSMAKEGMVTARTGITAEEGVEVVVAVPVVVVPVVVMSMAGGIAGRPDRCNVKTTTTTTGVAASASSINR